MCLNIFTKLIYIHSESIEYLTTVARGIEIIELLRGHTSGLAVPTYVVDAPGGGGKIPVGPQNLISRADGKILLRNYEGVICSYPEPTYEPAVYDNGCKTSLGQRKPVGLEKLITGEDISLVPKNTVRENRRKQFRKVVKRS
ncbi:MAG: hypothetical protein H0Z40_06545 [Desulfotomaculum sp.]|nr:hypothetical protein [Desulfotomaculum sp.]